jgi:hypothetical protein
MIMTNFAQRLKSVNFFQTIKFSNIDIIDVCTNFQKLFQRRNFSIIFFLNSSVTGMGVVFKNAKN